LDRRERRRGTLTAHRIRPLKNVRSQSPPLRERELSTHSGRSPDQTERPKPDTDAGCGVEFHLWPALPKRSAAHRRRTQLAV